MTYSYSVCHPDRKEIEFPDQKLSKDDVRNMFRTYPWVEILRSMDEMDPNTIFYSPSLAFTHISDKEV